MRSLVLASTSWLENSQRNNKCKNCIKMKNVNVHHKMKNVNVHHYLFLTETYEPWQGAHALFPPPLAKF